MRVRQLIQTAITIFSFCSLLLPDVATQQPVSDSVPANGAITPFEELSRQAESGDAEAQFSLGRAYETGNGTRQNPAKAAAWYRKSAELGNAHAQNSLGVMYWMGSGVDRDKEKAVDWYRKAAKQLEPSALFNLGAAYYNGEGATADSVQALAWFLLSAEAGSSAGQDAAKRSQGEGQPWVSNDAYVRIAQMYEKGDKLPKNIEQTVVWYRKAANAGSREAMIGLAVLYLRANDAVQARPWCEAAATAETAAGYHCLGYLYQHGAGVAQDQKKAFKYYRVAAGMAHPPSMHALALMYESGEGTNVDRLKAFSWSIAGARRGNQDSLTEARKLRSSMNDKEWKNAQKKLPPGFTLEMVNNILQGDKVSDRSH